jgi:predicted phosphoribosyltransferase
VSETIFQDRRDAGRTLAKFVAALPGLGDAVVLALPRGGVPVAFEVARACKLPLDILLVRKLGAPGQRELAMGAIASGGTTVLNQDVLHALHVPQRILDAVVEREQRNLEHMEAAYREGRPPTPIEGRTAILVDDGLATGASMRAAVHAVRARAKEVIVAVPVGARSTCADMKREADQVICATEPEPLDAVGRFYRNFDPTTDDEVRMLLAEARTTSPAPPPS